MGFDSETLQQQIPYYLTAAPEQKAFLAEVRALSSGVGRGYYLPKASDPYGETLLQGDGWSGFQVFSFVKEKSYSVRGIVLSNSCDVSSDNARAVPIKTVFAPIVKLSNLKQRFEQYGLEPGQIEAKLQSIRSQSVTNVFYLPAEGELSEEHVVLLDDLHSLPPEIHRTAQKLFTLSMAGFYLFIFKLSVHFCRLHENINRSAA